MRSIKLVPLLAVLAVSACKSSSGGSTGGGGAAAKGPSLPAGVTAAMVVEGDSLFNRTVPQVTPCARCHGARGVGAQNGPSLVAGPWLQIDGSYDSIVGIITTGVPTDKIKDKTHRFGMQARVMQVTDAQIKVLAAYIYSISRAKTKA